MKFAAPCSTPLTLKAIEPAATGGLPEGRREWAHYNPACGSWRKVSRGGAVNELCAGRGAGQAFSPLKARNISGGQILTCAVTSRGVSCRRLARVVASCIALADATRVR